MIQITISDDYQILLTYSCVFGKMIKNMTTTGFCIIFVRIKIAGLIAVLGYYLPALFRPHKIMQKPRRQMTQIAGWSRRPLPPSMSRWPLAQLLYAGPPTRSVFEIAYKPQHNGI
jgi:hypothetical protein